MFFAVAASFLLSNKLFWIRIQYCLTYKWCGESNGQITFAFGLVEDLQTINNKCFSYFKLGW